MNKLKTIFKEEIQGWKTAEVIWLAVAVLTIIGLSIYWNDTLMGVISSATGVACVVCTGKGKLSAYLFGVINCVLYAIIAFKAHYYGETMLNLLYYVPMQFIGFRVWYKNMNNETHEVSKRHMSNKSRILALLAMAGCTYLYGLVLKRMGDAMPFVDSFTTVSSVIAMIISVKMYAEQWWMWVAVNLFSIYMWWTAFAANQDNIATLIMWIVYLGNSIIMLIKWEREVKRNNLDVKEAV